MRSILLSMYLIYPFFFSQSAAAQSAPEVTLMAELDETYDEELAADDDDAKRFLADNSEELRTQFTRGIILSLGASRPWQWLNLAFNQGENQFTVGFGKDSSERIFESSATAVNLTHLAVSAERRWFPVREFPLALTYGLSYGDWQGTSKFNREENKAYHASGLIGLASVGLHVQRPDCWYWGMSILGTSRSIILSESGNTQGGKVKRILEDQKNWGILNFSVGRFFE